MPCTLRIAISDDVAVVTLNRPAQRNAMSALLVEELIDVLLHLDSGDAARAVLLAGSGTGFCAGSDLVGLACMTDEAREAFEARSGRLARLIPRLSVPVVAAVHGFAVGGGLTLAAACDVVVSDADAKWSLPEVPIGLYPAWGLHAVEDRVGRPAARRLAWGCEMLDGAAAFRLGLADHLSEAAAITDALAVATALARLPKAQSAAVKRYFAAPDRAAMADAAALRLFMESTGTKEAADCFLRFAGRGKK